MPMIMPTAAKLAGGILFAGLGYGLASAIVPLLPEGTIVGYFREVSAALGLVIGWRNIGTEAGRGLGPALSVGLRTAALLMLAGILVFAFEAMIARSLLRFYEGPGAAFVGFVDFVVEFARYALVPRIMGILVLGGLVGGLVVEGVARIWK